MPVHYEFTQPFGTRKPGDVIEIEDGRAVDLSYLKPVEAPGAGADEEPETPAEPQAPLYPKKDEA